MYKRQGHTHLIHSYLSDDDQPTGSTCGHPLTVRHILLDCQDVDEDTSLLPVSEICLKLLTIVLLLILSKIYVQLRCYSLL